MIIRFIGESIREGVVDPEEVIVIALQIQQELQGLGDNDDGSKFAPILRRNSGSHRVAAGDSASALNSGMDTDQSTSSQVE